MKKSEPLSDAMIRIREARHHDPFEVLGRHPDGKKRERLTVFLPRAESVKVADGPELERVPHSDFFTWSGPAGTLGERCLITWIDPDGRRHQRHDPYCFPPQLGDLDLHLFGEGKHWHAYRFLGAHPHTADNVDGMLFSVWAPHAERISVVGDFNGWDGRVHPMRVRGGSGVWELFIPAIGDGAHYKFEIRNRDTGAVFLKSDPYGQRYEMRPGTASITIGDSTFPWEDEDWMERREKADWLHAPMSVYELHLGSWRRDAEGGFLNYRELAHQVVAHVEALGFTHIELLPVAEHPLDASWGYQCLGHYAPTSRHGEPDDFRYFVNHCHKHGIGIILDWVPAHFPKDAHGLGRFDGTALYEHEDPRQGEHRDWSTLIFNYGRNEVKNFLLSNALYWLEEFHLDGLRVDAVASMLYLDYSREAGEWVPNKFGGRENLEAIDFLRELNHVAHGEHPGALIVAEESTAWPQVTKPTYVGGLGFSMKWNMGWMNDTLEYFHKEPVYRAYHHDWLTFSMLYAFTENFVLPFSHDEVVHGKGSMLDKMPGDAWQKFANLRLLYCYQYLHPGKKLLFMGCEFGQGREWDFDSQLDWHLLEYPFQSGVQTLVRDLNQLYRGEPALHAKEFEWDGFEWIDCHDSSQSTISFLRKNGERSLLVVLNFTPEPRGDYRIGVPAPGTYKEVLNSDSEYYAGSNTGNDVVVSEDTPWMGRDHSVVLTLPPLGAIVLRLEE